MKIRKLLASSAVFTMLLLCTVNKANATLIDNGDITLDTSTGLEWLDLTQTTNFSVLDILQGAGGFAADGWIHATNQDISNLFASFLGSALTPNFDASGNAPSFDILANSDAIGLVDLLGATFNTGLIGFFDNGNLNSVSSQIIACINTLATATCQNIATQLSQAGLVKSNIATPNANQFTNPNFGHFLVRTAQVEVPTPNTLTIFAIAFIGLTISRFKQKA